MAESNQNKTKLIVIQPVIVINPTASVLLTNGNSTVNSTASTFSDDHNQRAQASVSFVALEQSEDGSSTNASMNITTAQQINLLSACDCKLDITNRCNISKIDMIKLLTTNVCAEHVTNIFETKVLTEDIVTAMASADVPNGAHVPTSANVPRSTVISAATEHVAINHATTANLNPVPKSANVPETIIRLLSSNTKVVDLTKVLSANEIAADISPNLDTYRLMTTNDTSYELAVQNCLPMPDALPRGDSSSARPVPNNKLQSYGPQESRSIQKTHKHTRETVDMLPSPLHIISNVFGLDNLDIVSDIVTCNGSGVKTEIKFLNEVVKVNVDKSIESSSAFVEKSIEPSSSAAVTLQPHEHVKMMTSRTPLVLQTTLFDSGDEVTNSTNSDCEIANSANSDCEDRMEPSDDETLTGDELTQEKQTKETRQFPVDSIRNIDFSEVSGQVKVEQSEFPVSQSDDIGMETESLERTVLKCPVCNKTQSDIRQFKRHVRRHNQTRLLCDICGAFARTKYNLDYHKQAIHSIGDRSLFMKRNENKHVCQICGKIFGYVGSLRVHVRIHTDTGERPHKCDKCSKAYKYVNQLNDHKKIHRGFRPFACDVCPIRCYRRNDLAAHIRTHSGLKPYKCEQQCLNKKKEKTLECDICHQTFPNPRSLSAHKRHHFSERKPNPKKIDLIKNEQNLKSSLERNMKFICPVCGIGYMFKSLLKRHHLRHEGVKPFGCDMCEKAFCTKKELNDHRPLHFNERPFVCPKCDKGFKIKHALKSHQRKYCI